MSKSKAELIDALDCAEKGLAEWRSEYQQAAKQAEAARATARVAIAHLNMVLNNCRTASEQKVADTLARDWLTSIGI